MDRTVSIENLPRLLLQALNMKFGEQIYVFCSDDKNARCDVVSIGGARCISVLSSFVVYEDHTEMCGPFIMQKINPEGRVG